MLVRQEDGTVSQMDMDGYLVGVVLAEMPVSFEEEALEAQSVVARTYARKAWETGGKHGDCSVCTRSACCQGYIGDEDYLSQGGTEEGLEKVRAAVAATSGWVLTYEGELIEATYFSCSGGSTEDAAAVWGSGVAPTCRPWPAPARKRRRITRIRCACRRERFRMPLRVASSAAAPEAGSGT